MWPESGLHRYSWKSFIGLSKQTERFLTFYFYSHWHPVYNFGKAFNIILKWLILQFLGDITNFGSYIYIRPNGTNCTFLMLSLFSSAAHEGRRFIKNPSFSEILNCQKVLKKLCRVIGLGKCENAFALLLHRWEFVFPRFPKLDKKLYFCARIGTKALICKFMVG